MHLTYNKSKENNTNKLFVNSIDNINAINLSKRPFVKVICKNVSSDWLYDTGADVSVMSFDLFEKLKGNQFNKVTTNSHLKSASKSSLHIHGVFELPLSVMGKELVHPVYICKNLNQNAIMGIDMIAKLNLNFNVKNRSFQINQIEKEYSLELMTISQEKIPALTALPLRLQGVTQKGERPNLNSTFVAKIFNSEFPCLFANKGLVAPNRLGEVTVWVKNCHPFEIELRRGDKIGSLEKVNNKCIAQIDQQRFLDCLLYTSDAADE